MINKKAVQSKIFVQLHGQSSTWCRLLHKASSSGLTPKQFEATQLIEQMQDKITDFKRQVRPLKAENFSDTISLRYSSQSLMLLLNIVVCLLFNFAIFEGSFGAENASLRLTRLTIEALPTSVSVALGIGLCPQ